MDQTTTASQGSDLEALRLQLEEDGKYYCNNSNSHEARDRLLHTLQTNDCREIIAAIVNGSDLANAFVRAVVQNHVYILQAFLNHGMNVDIRSQGGSTALMVASYGGREVCVRLLLDHNAKVDVQSNLGIAALMFACREGKTKVVEMLLEKNANPDLQDNHGMTALMYASENSRKEIVELLLNRGVDIDLKEKDGKTALDRAKTEEIKEMLRNHVTTSYVLK
jgi:ankyrin repeat protein